MSFFSQIRNRFRRRRPKPTTEEAEALVDGLIGLGFLKFLAADSHSAVRSQLIQSVCSGFFDSDWGEDCHCADQRNYRADNENLAEGDVGRSILAMKDVLIQEGVNLNEVRDDFGEERYQVVINKIPHLIYDNSGDPQRDWWTIATKRLLEIVNKLLGEAGSEERLYAVNGGNDGRVILLTPAMYNLIRHHAGFFRDDDLPRAPEELRLTESL